MNRKLNSKLGALLVAGALVFMTGCTSIFFQPSRERFADPTRFGYPENDVNIVSADGTKLHAWHFKAQGEKKPRLLILQFHGNAENISSHFMSLVWLTQQGYDLLTFDYRGYGSSEGKEDPKGAVQDGIAALEFAQQLAKSRGASGLVVYAQSLGGALAMESFLEWKDQLPEHAKDVQFLVLDSTFVSYKRMAQSALANGWLTWIFSPLGQVLVSDATSAKDRLSELTLPKLIIHDENDPVVDFGNGQRLFNALPEPKEFWKLQDGRHVGIFSIDRLENRDRFLKKLDQLE